MIVMDLRNKTKYRLTPSNARRLISLSALALALVLSTGLLQGQSSDRAKVLGAKLICMCNCGQILTACNHVSCPRSGPMLKQLDQRIAQGGVDDLILQSFVQEYGEQVLSEPPTHGFSALAWAIPGIAFALGLGLVIMVIRHWRQPAAVAPVSGPVVSVGALERARRQVERELED
jgi:cytochrome c-type biogenesis protein CcmH